MKKIKLLFILFFALAVLPVAMAQQIKISGQVTSASNGETLPGVSVVVKGTTSGVATDIEGKYSLEEIGRAHV